MVQGVQPDSLGFRLRASGEMMPAMRLRVAALIERKGQLLVMRQRARGPSNRHDGVLYRTPPGGVEPGETLAEAIGREVREETGLLVTSAVYVSQIEHPGGVTVVFQTMVEPGEPVLGVDPEIDCDCPRLVGLEWIAAPPVGAWAGPDAQSLLKGALPE